MVGTLLYTLNKNRIATRRLQSFAACLLMGLVLGCMSSFLGIGGGIIGRKVNSRIEGKTVERLFLILMAVIICISVFNTWRYAVL